MEMAAKNIEHNQAMKAHKSLHAAEIFLRVLATAGTLAATWIMFTSKQTSLVFGINVDARYSYSPAFLFFAYANLIACGLTVLSLFLVLILGRKANDTNTKNYFFIFMHDLFVTTLLMAGCAAAAAIGYVGKYGNDHTGWMPICDHFGKFCNRVTISVIFSFLCVIFYLSLTIISAIKSRQI